MTTNKTTEAEDDPADELGRGNLTLERRVELLERDRAQQSRAITELVQKIQKGFSSEQVGQIRSAFREELADAGLRLNDASQQDEARRDFMFLRSFRTGINGFASKIGWVVILAIVGAALTLFQMGVNAWRGG